MGKCQKCGSGDLIPKDMGASCWVEVCSSCGHEFGGTAYFLPFDADSPRKVNCSLKLESIDSFAVLRKLVWEIGAMPASVALQKLRDNDWTWTLESLPYHRALALQTSCTDSEISCQLTDRLD